MNTKRYSLIIFYCMLALVILFFFPWFSTNMHSTVLTSQDIVSGTNIVKYGQMLGDLMGTSGGFSIKLLIASATHIYILPAMAAIAMVLIIFFKKPGAIFSIVAASFHLIFTLIFLMMPKDVSELVHLIFIFTPTIYLYGIAGLAAIIAAVILLITLKKEAPAAKKPRQPRAKRAPRAKKETEDAKTAPKKRAPKKKAEKRPKKSIDVSRSK